MPCCAVSACLNRTYKKSKSQIETEKTSKITFHRFPKAENQRLKWVECTQLPLTSLPAIAYLCSVHFAEDSIDRTSLSCTRLKRDAIPAINITNTGKPENLSEHEHEHVSQVQQDVYPSTSKTIDKEIPEEIFDDFTCGKTDANTRSDLLKTLFENTPKRIHKCDVTTECKPQKRQCIQSALCEQTVQGTQVKSESSSEMTDDTYLSKSPFLINQQNNEALSDSRGQLQYTPRKILLCKTLKAQQDISRRQIQTLKKRNKRQEKKIAILNSILNELKAKQMLDEEQLDLLRTIVFATNASTYKEIGESKRKTKINIRSMPFSKSRRSTFNIQWLNEDHFSPWLKECKNDKFAFYCIMCKKTVLLSNVGRQALTSHMKGRKHEHAARSQNNTFGIGVFLSPKTVDVPKSTTLRLDGSLIANVEKIAEVQETEKTGTISQPSTSTQLESTSLLHILPKQRGMNRFIEKEKVMRAEIIWCLQTVFCHLSLAAAGKCTEIFKLMFDENGTAKAMTLGPNKMGHTTSADLLTTFKTELSSLNMKNLLQFF
ncbi:uncharacterized protein [Neodiprion pinetum]|uniref:uncharacterized protein isoform X3 n=1 Tax=Neodiprion pinetum TaxID=441929 RepID=UPI003711FDD7